MTFNIIYCNGALDLFQIKMLPEKRRLGSLLALAGYFCLCYGKAVIEESPSYYGGYEYSYNFKTGQHEVKPLYDENYWMPSTEDHEVPRSYSTQSSNHAQSIYVPPIEHNDDELKKILDDYYNKDKKSMHKEVVTKEKEYTHQTSTAAWVPEPSSKYAVEEYEDNLYKTPVISKRKRKPVKTENGGHCTDCHISPTEYEMLDHKKLKLKVKKAPKSKQANKPKTVSKETNDGITDDKYESSKDSPVGYPKSSHEDSSSYIKVIKRKKYGEKDISKTERVSEERIGEISPIMKETMSKKEVEPIVEYDLKSKIEYSPENKEKLEGTDYVKVKSKEQKDTLKHEIKNTHLGSHTDIKGKSDYEIAETLEGIDEDFEYGNGESLESDISEMEPKDENFLLEDEDSDVVIIPVFRTKSTSGNKENTKCIQSKSKNGGKHEVCAENNKPKPKPTITHPKVVPVKDKVVPVKPKDKIVLQPSVNSGKDTENKYKPPGKYYINHKKVKDSKEDEPSLNHEEEKIYQTAKFPTDETSDIDETDSVNFDDLSTDELSKHNINEQVDIKKPGIMNENINLSQDTENSELDLEPEGSGVMMGESSFKGFQDADDKLRKLPFLNSNIWSLISNPNAKNHNLRQCVTRNNETGFCMYMQQCQIPDIATSLEQLLNNACVIDDVFIGICCPEFPVETVKVQWGDIERNSVHIKVEDELDLENEDCGTRSTVSSSIQSWPWKAPLVSMSNGKIFCGGVIIGEKYILTAAHCTTNIPRNQILVRLGQHNESSGEDVTVTEIKRHAQYNSRTLQNDIALLKLSSRVPHTEHTTMVCLPDEKDDHSGKKAILLGWQGMFGENPTKSELLEVMSNEECSKSVNAPDSILCTEARNEDETTCNADSGAPLVIKDEDKYEVVGILSWNRNDCDKRFPSVFSRVSSYVKWIQNHAV